jgi:hypothetical protein
MRHKMFIVSILLAFLSLVAVNQAYAGRSEEYPIAVIQENPCFTDIDKLPTYFVKHDQSGTVVSSSYRCRINEVQARKMGIQYLTNFNRADNAITQKVIIPDASIIPYELISWNHDHSEANSEITDCLSSSLVPFRNSSHLLDSTIQRQESGDHEITWLISKRGSDYWTSYRQLRKVDRVANCHIRQTVQGDILLVKADNGVGTIYEIGLPTVSITLGRIVPFARTELYVPLRPYFGEYYKRPVKFTINIDSSWKQCRANRKLRVSAKRKRSATIRIRKPQSLITIPKRFFTSRTFLLTVLRVNRRGGTCGSAKTRLRLKPGIKRPQSGGGAPPQYGSSPRPYLTGSDGMTRFSFPMVGRRPAH